MLGMDMATKCFCRECDWRGTWGDVLKAPNPFAPEEEIMGCPDCKAVDDTLRTACYETGCWKEASCGSPYPDGVYRWSCYKHGNLKTA